MCLCVIMVGLTLIVSECIVSVCVCMSLMSL